ncbi:MAG TPA: DUF3987 domain-containing protein [Polyangiaceae bacterium]|nr:DUF3987 domain-containing protein [Polyangiaceae bacterium]
MSKPKPPDWNDLKRAGRLSPDFDFFEAAEPMGGPAPAPVVRIGPWASLPLEPHPDLAGAAGGEGGPPRPPFPVEAFPEDVAAFVRAVATFTQTPPDLAGCLALGVLSASVAGKARVRVKGHYAEPLNLFVVAAMAPGERKSAVFRSMFGPFARYEKHLRESGKQKRDAVKAERKALEEANASIRRRLARAKDETRLELEGEMRDNLDRLAALPAAEDPVLYLQDATAESLARALEAQGGRIAIADAEGVFFNNITGRYGDEVNLDTLLKGHAGDFLRVERVGRPAQNIDRPAVTLAMAVQPDVLRTLATKPGVRDRGLLGRLLMALPPSLVGAREVDPPDVPRPVWARYSDAVRRLLELVTPSEDWLLELEPQALAAWHDLSRDVERMLRKGGELADMRDWGSKLAGAVARVAGVLHWARAACAGPEALREAWGAPVTEGEMLSAVELGWYFVDHARSIYDELLVAKEEREARGRLQDALAALEWLYPEGQGFTVSEALERLFPPTKLAPPPAAAAAREALSAFAGARGNDPPKPIALGKALSASKGKEAGGRRLEHAGGAHRKVAKWAVVRAPARGGEGGIPSASSPPSGEAEKGCERASGGMRGIGGVPGEKTTTEAASEGTVRHELAPPSDTRPPSARPARPEQQEASSPFRGIEGGAGSIPLARNGAGRREERPGRGAHESPAERPASAGAGRPDGPPAPPAPTPDRSFRKREATSWRSDTNCPCSCRYAPSTARRPTASLPPASPGSRRPSASSRPPATRRSASRRSARRSTSASAARSGKSPCSAKSAGSAPTSRSSGSTPRTSFGPSRRTRASRNPRCRSTTEGPAMSRPKAALGGSLVDLAGRALGALVAGAVMAGLWGPATRALERFDRATGWLLDPLLDWAQGRRGGGRG